MICLFGTGTGAKTNEEYKMVVKRRMLYQVFLLVLGMITLGFAAAAYQGSLVMISDYMQGVYTGVGFGFIAGSIVALIRNYRTLHNEEKLKAERLRNTDERNVLIYGKSLQYAGAFTLLCAYLAMLIAGIYSEVVFHCFYAIVMAFILFYLIVRAILSRKM